MDEREQRVSLTLTAEKFSLEDQETRPTTRCPSTFSQLTDPNSPDPFSQRKNPSLTINVSQNNRINKGKGRGRSSVSIRKSFLARALNITKEPDNSYVSTTKIAGNRNLQKAMKSINVP